MDSFKNNDLTEALQLAQQAAAQGAGAPAHVLIGRIRTIEHDQLGAEKAFREALRLDPRNVQAARRLEQLRGSPAEGAP